AHVAAGTDNAATKPTSAPTTSRIAKSATTARGRPIRSRRCTAGCRMSCNTKASTTGNMIELATYTAAKTANVNKLPRKNVCGLDGSGISTLSTACLSKETD